MTAKKDLKRRVRERQAKTGESYTAARAQIVDEPEEKESAIPVVELVDATDEATKLGLQCDVLVEPNLARRIAPARILERLRDALIATEDDPQTKLLRGVILRGEAPVGRGRPPDWWDEMKRFFARARVGIGGTSDGGTLLALQVDDVMVIVQTGHVPHIQRERRRVYITTPDSHMISNAMIVPR